MMPNGLALRAIGHHRRMNKTSVTAILDRLVELQVKDYKL